VDAAHRGPGGRENVTVSLGLTRDIEPGLVKAALHFIAAFMDDVVVPDELREVVLRNRVPDEDGVYVRPLRADPPLFGESWPPSHELTAYPGQDGAYATIMLYGVFAMVVRLPDVRVSHALRYVERFDGSGPMLVDAEPRLVPWASAGISPNVRTAFFADLEERLARIDRFNEARIEHDLCVRAARAAHDKGKTFRTGFLDLFRAELDLLAPAAGEKGRAGRSHASQARRRNHPVEDPDELGTGWPELRRHRLIAAAEDRRSVSRESILSRMRRTRCAVELVRAAGAAMSLDVLLRKNITLASHLANAEDRGIDGPSFLEEMAEALRGESEPTIR